MHFARIKAAMAKSLGLSFLLLAPGPSILFIPAKYLCNNNFEEKTSLQKCWPVHVFRAVAFTEGSLLSLKRHPSGKMNWKKVIGFLSTNMALHQAAC